MPDISDMMVEMSRRDKAIIVLHSQMLFIYQFFGDEMTISPERTDLPREWHNQQLMSEKQRFMLCDRSKQVAYRTSRKIAKTIFLAADFFRWSIWHAGRGPTDGLLHTPREHHLTNIRLRLEKKINHIPLFRLLITTVNRSKGFIETSTGITWFMRIEGRTGTGESMVGPAASYEIGDEQDYAGWGPFNERQQAVLPGSLRALGGVPRGVQGGPFWTIANRREQGKGWSVFTGVDGYNCFINPIYQSDEAKERLIIDHGGKDTQAYQTQVLGLDGMRVFSSFPIIPMVVRDFSLIEVTGEDVDSGIFHAELGSVVWTPSEMYFIAGDMGSAPSPTEVAVFYHFKGAWIEAMRMHLTISDSHQTAEAIHAINISLPHPAQIIVIDAHVAGVGILDRLHKNEKWAIHEYGRKVVDAEFANYVDDPRKLVHPICKHVVRSTDMGWYCDSCGMPIFRRDDLEAARVQTKQWALSALKDSFSAGQRWLTEQEQKFDYPPLVLSVEDEPLLMNLEGTTEKETTGGNVQWNSPSRHLTDMMLCATIAGRRLSDIGREEEIPTWLEEVGWTGGEGEGQLMPWEVAYA